MTPAHPKECNIVGGFRASKRSACMSWAGDSTHLLACAPSHGQPCKKVVHGRTMDSRISRDGRRIKIAAMTFCTSDLSLSQNWSIHSETGKFPCKQFVSFKQTIPTDRRRRKKSAFQPSCSIPTMTLSN